MQKGTEVGLPGRRTKTISSGPPLLTECFRGRHRERNPNPNFLVRIFFRWGGGLPRERVGAKKFDTSLETREIKLFGRDIPGLCRDIPELPEKFEKSKFVFNSRPLSGGGTEVRSGPGKPNQKKSVHELFARGIPEQKFNVNRACFPKEKHQNSQKKNG